MGSVIKDVPQALVSGRNGGAIPLFIHIYFFVDLYCISQSHRPFFSSDPIEVPTKVTTIPVEKVTEV